MRRPLKALKLGFFLGSLSLVREKKDIKLYSNRVRNLFILLFL